MSVYEEVFLTILAVLFWLSPLISLGLVVLGMVVAFNKKRLLGISIILTGIAVVLPMIFVFLLVSQLGPDVRH